VSVLGAPVVLSGGMSDDQAIVEAWEQTGAEAVMIARGSFGDPWRFERLLGLRTDPVTPDEIVEELRWVIDRGEEHLGAERAGRYLRKFYPWYAEALGLTKRQREPLVTAPTTADARAALDDLAAAEPSILAA
jgi:tRNA-dihydrouridine synthase B